MGLPLENHPKTFVLRWWSLGVEYGRIANEPAIFTPENGVESYDSDARIGTAVSHSFPNSRLLDG